MTTDPNDVVREGADPLTSGTRLAEIAQNYPFARAAVAGNPSTYPGLLTWLGDLGDATVTAVLAGRNSSSPSGQAPPLPPAAPASPVSGVPQSGPRSTSGLDIAAMVLAIFVPLAGAVLAAISIEQDRKRGLRPSSVARIAQTVALLLFIVSCIGGVVFVLYFMGAI